MKRYLPLGILAVIVTLGLLLLPFMVVVSFPTDLKSGERHLRFTTDGAVSHYYVERYNKSQWAYVDIYWNLDSSLDVETINVENITIDCNGLFAQHKDEVWLYPGESEDYWYSAWIESNSVYQVNFVNDLVLNTITFYDINVDPVGATLNGLQVPWSNDGKTIRVTTPTLTGDDVILIYFDEELFRERAEYYQDVDVYEGWNFYSNPFGDELYLSEFFLYDEVTAVTYKHNSEFKTTFEDNGEVLSPHEGYWLFSTEDKEITLTSTDKIDNKIYLNTGWSMTGAPQELKVSEILDDGLIVTSVAYLDENQTWVTAVYGTDYIDYTLQENQPFFAYSVQTTALLLKVLE